MSGKIDDYSKADLTGIEDLYAKLQIKSFSDEGLDDYSDNLSVSMPISKKIEFLDACRFNGRYWRDVLLDFISWYTEKNSPEVCQTKCNKKIEEWLQRKVRIDERIKRQGKKADTIRKHIEDVFEAVGVEKTGTGRGANKSFIDRTKPVQYSEVRLIFTKLEDTFNKKYKRHIENNGHRFSLSELYPYVFERAMKVPNEVVRSSLIENLKQFKEVVDRDPQLVEESETKKLRDELLDEYFKSRSTAESNDLNDLKAELEAEQVGISQPNFGAGAVVKRDGR